MRISGKIAERIVHEIIQDIMDRMGFCGQWELTDEETQNEIIETWRCIVETNLLISGFKISEQSECPKST